MKKYILKKYKGNLAESLDKFNRKYPRMRIVEAIENDNSLTVTAEASGESPDPDFNMAWNIIVHGSDQLLNQIEVVYREMKKLGDISVSRLRDALSSASYSDKAYEFFSKVWPEAVRNPEGYWSTGSDMALNILFSMAFICNQ